MHFKQKCSRSPFPDPPFPSTIFWEISCAFQDAISTPTMIHMHVTQACAWQRPLCVFWVGNSEVYLVFSSGVWSVGSACPTILQLRIFVKWSHLTSLCSSRCLPSLMQSWLGNPMRASSEIFSCMKKDLPDTVKRMEVFTHAVWALPFSDWLGILSTGNSRLSTLIKPLKSQAGNQENIKDKGNLEWNDITFLILIVLYFKSGHRCCYKLCSS